MVLNVSEIGMSMPEKRQVLPWAFCWFARNRKW
jgi:hypothetical protein